MISMKVTIIFLSTLVLMASRAVCFPSAGANTDYVSPFLNKEYKLDHSDDSFDDVMKALGVGFLQRKLGKLAHPIMKLTEKDGVYTLTSESTFKNTETKFRIGEEFDDETPDGRQVKSVFSLDKNRLTQLQRGEKTTTIVREFSADEVKVTVRVGDVESVRIYKAI